MSNKNIVGIYISQNSVTSVTFVTTPHRWVILYPSTQELCHFEVTKRVTELLPELLPGENHEVL